jgi:methylated-DNA-[protein]-cysteine S-methyltransferase
MENAAFTPSAAIGGYHAPFGLILLAAGPDGLVGMDLASTDAEDFAIRLGQRLGGYVGSRHEPAVPAAWREILELAAQELDEYFAGSRQHFEVPLDLRVSDPDRSVLAATADLAYGTTSSYGALARAIGKPGAGRAVGGALGRNPLPVFIPCHRVVAAGGDLGGYGGGWHGSEQARSRAQLLEIKRRLLTLEGAWPAA